MLAAVVLALLGTSATAPASAAPYVWQTYTLTSHWHCTHRDWGTPGVSSAACVIVSGNSTQTAVIVSNNSTRPVTVIAPVLRLWVNGGFEYQHSCPQFTLNHGSGFSRACFAPTVTYPCSSYAQSEVAVTIDNAGYWDDSPLRKMCT